ncbi:MAG: cysteine protease, partial [Marinobacter sp.]|nr:cysteine protease [Marinobacter sp.]
VEPLEFDGIHDSVFQEYTESGQAHMEYINDHGVFDDVPHDFIVEGVRAAYGHLFSGENAPGNSRRSLEEEVAKD